MESESPASENSLILSGSDFISLKKFFPRMNDDMMMTNHQPQNHSNTEMNPIITYLVIFLYIARALTSVKGSPVGVVIPLSFSFSLIFFQFPTSPCMVFQSSRK